MKTLFTFLLIIFQFSSSIKAQTNETGQFPVGIIFGPKGAFKIAAPKNWVLDNEVGISMGLPCVLYLENFNWENSPVIMYAKIASTQFEIVDKFIDFAINEFKKEDPKFNYKKIKVGEIKKHKYIIMDYLGGPYNSYERVIYFQMKKAIGYIVFSARNEIDFNKYSDAIFEIVDTFEYKPEYINYQNK